MRRTVEDDPPREIDYLRRHNQALQRIMLPDRRAENLPMFIRQNSGVLSKNRREAEFAQLSDDEVQRIERIVVDAFEAFSVGGDQAGTKSAEGAGRRPEA